MAEEKNHAEQQKFLFEIIKRYDLYINTTNSKIAIVLSYCMAFIGGLGFKLNTVHLITTLGAIR